MVLNLGRRTAADELLQTTAADELLQTYYYEQTIKTVTDVSYIPVCHLSTICEPPVYRFVVVHRLYKTLSGVTFNFSWCIIAILILIIEREDEEALVMKGTTAIYI